MSMKWCQSKHVHLIKKCYPPKTANPPKPNSSELSYLTYYAYTTPSKLKKVGKYLEHRAEVGLTKGRTGYSAIFQDGLMVQGCYCYFGYLYCLDQKVLSRFGIICFEYCCYSGCCGERRGTSPC
jgi:hypothetical protein